MDNTSKRSSLSPPEDNVPSGADTPVNRFTLDTVIEDEGGNLSIGQVCDVIRGISEVFQIFPYQRSLVSLARALVKDAKVIILDEATGSYTHFHGTVHFLNKLFTRFSFR